MDDLADAQNGQHGKPDEHDRAEGSAYHFCAESLEYEKQQQDELRNEAHVEEVTGGQQNVFSPRNRSGVEQDQDNGEKDKKLRGIEQHELILRRTQDSANLGWKQSASGTSQVRRTPILPARMVVKTTARPAKASVQNRVTVNP